MPRLNYGDLITLANGGGINVALASPPANLNAGANTALTFAQTVYRVYVENNTAEAKNVAFPSPATAGSYKVPAGAAMAYTIPGGTTTVGVYGASASPLGGSAASNLIVEGQT